VYKIARTKDDKYKLANGYTTADGYTTYTSSQGDCGAPVFDDDMCVLGWHNGGSQTVSKFVPVTQQMIKDLDFQ
jgi:hypothetical protein